MDSYNDFLESFTKVLDKEKIDTKNPKTELSLFVHNINANSFNYTLVKERLLEPLADFALSGKTREKLKDKPLTLSKKAREKFIQEMNTGELGELLLYCFLRAHLKAPKILSKLELKTSNKFYVNGSDGIHFLKLENGNYQIIFGESKTIISLSTAISEALKSIYEFKNEINSKGKIKSGITYEKTLISTHLENENFTKEEEKIIEDLIYPKESNNFNVDDAFGLFLGYEIQIEDEERKLPHDEFRIQVHEKIQNEVEKQFPNIVKKINEYALQGHSIYLYILPFTNLEQTREDIFTAIRS